MGKQRHRHLVLYDGVCALCNRSVRFLLRVDRRRSLAFAPLQGSTAAVVLSRHRLPADLQTLVLVRDHGTADERIETRSGGVLSALVAAGGGWRLLAGLRLVPRPIRDWVYGRVAANRYRWFGRYDSCPLPPSTDGDRFLE